MSYYSNYTFTYNPGLVANGRRNINLGLTRMVTDIHSRAVMNAPKLTRALANSGRFQKTGPMSYTVTFGGGRVRYARVREYYNNLHPNTRFYLKNAGNSVAANASHYFQNII